MSFLDRKITHIHSLTSSLHPSRGGWVEKNVISAYRLKIMQKLVW